MESKNKQNSCVIVALYSHPEFYPPTLNAIGELSKKFDKVMVYSRNVLKSEWLYPENVELIGIGPIMSIRESENKSFIFKMLIFIQYTIGFLKLIRKSKPKIIKVCDVIPLLSLSIIKTFLPSKIKFWYHNHDVADVNVSRKYTIGWFAAKSEGNMFNYLHILTLPAREREIYFPMFQLKGNYYFLPNYPSIDFYKNFWIENKSIKDELRLIYQGTISSGHGIEEIIGIMNNLICGKFVTLHLKGFIAEKYKLELLLCAEKNNVTCQLFFYPVSAYQDVPKLAATCHVGIGIHTGVDIMNTSLGTSSNKIYEYAALGLPVLLYKNKHFYDILGQYDWVRFTDLTQVDLISCLVSIVENYQKNSLNAVESFRNHLNFKEYFDNIKI